MKRILYMTLMLILPAVGVAQNNRINEMYEEFNRKVEECYASFNEKIAEMSKQFEEEMTAQWVLFPQFETPVPKREPDPFWGWEWDTWPEDGGRCFPAGGIARPELRITELATTESTAPAPVAPPAPLPADNPEAWEMVTINPFFLQTLLNCQSPRQCMGSSIATLGPVDIAEFYKEIRESISPIANFCANYIQKAQLCDWAVFQLAKSVAVQLYPNRSDEQAVATVCLLNHLGYMARVGKSQDAAVCMLPIEGIIYGASGYHIDGKSYYGFGMDPAESYLRNCTTYAVDYPEASKTIDLNIYRPMHLEYVPSDHTFISSYKGDTVEITINASLIDLYAGYPWTTLDVYANAQPDPAWVAEMEKVFEPRLRDKPERRQVAAILDYVQHSFKYATDQDQFGKEKYFFCEENFYYPSNDCEDHAILFSFLVRHFLSLEVVLLDYPDHVATAVRFSDPDAKGDAVIHNGRKYIVCDPTYTGATIGETMPGYETASVEIVELKEI